MNVGHVDETTLIFLLCGPSDPNAGAASLWRLSHWQQEADAEQGQVHPDEALLLLPRPGPPLMSDLYHQESFERKWHVYMPAVALLLWILLNLFGPLSVAGSWTWEIFMVVVKKVRNKQETVTSNTANIPWKMSHFTEMPWWHNAGDCFCWFQLKLLNTRTVSLQFEVNCAMTSIICWHRRNTGVSPECF